MPARGPFLPSAGRAERRSFLPFAVEAREKNGIREK
jgi:hypothetical protein